jgi:sRNA-binding carbon storage regulator CsrA
LINSQRDTLEVWPSNNNNIALLIGSQILQINFLNLIQFNSIQIKSNQFKSVDIFNQSINQSIKQNETNSKESTQALASLLGDFIRVGTFGGAKGDEEMVNLVSWLVGWLFGWLVRFVGE